MSLPAGTVEYSFGTPLVCGFGFSWLTSELDTALAGPVSKVVFDESGKTVISDLLSGLTETGFEKSQVERILTVAKPPENWRVGEAIVESYLVKRKNCYFPWPDGRDERKTGSSLPGADLVGFQIDDGENYFAFGEVKTSSEKKRPPGAMHGRHGLKQQLEAIKDDTKIKDDLVKYLAYRAATAEWKSRYREAAKRYLQSNTAVRVFGFLVRDVEPHQDDLRARVDKLSRGAHVDMKIELLAVYLPVGSIPTLRAKVTELRKGGAG